MRARIAGILYFVSLGAAVADEALVHGKMLYVVSIVPIVAFLIATLLIYRVFKPVSASAALLGAACNIVSLGFEAVEVHPGGVNAGLVFHGLYCAFIGYAAFRSAFVPQGLGIVMIAAGFAWLLHGLPAIDAIVSPYVTPVGFIGEGAFMLWLLVMGDSRRHVAAAHRHHNAPEPRV